MSHSFSCPTCGEMSVVYIEQVEEIQLGDERIPIQARFFRCTGCGEEFEIIRPDEYDPLAEAYAEYERRTGRPWKGIYGGEN